MNNKRYWLVGALYSLAICVILLLLLVIISNLAGNSCTGDICSPRLATVPLFNWIISVFLWPIAIVSAMGLDYNVKIILMIILVGVYYSIIGAIIGWLYGKIKNKKG